MATSRSRGYPGLALESVRAAHSMTHDAVVHAKPSTAVASCQQLLSPSHPATALHAAISTAHCCSHDGMGRSTLLQLALLGPHGDGTSLHRSPGGLVGAPVGAAVGLGVVARHTASKSAQHSPKTSHCASHWHGSPSLKPHTGSHPFCAQLAPVSPLHCPGWPATPSRSDSAAANNARRMTAARSIVVGPKSQVAQLAASTSTVSRTSSGSKHLTV
mmetsp:Transcript_27293/g.81780  ORF Transcript_27293/g.81780 Transcript_27293/m.81780 type:complete len:216 (-) Transcript_27293:159-806(-)